VNVSITELRAHLADWLEQVQQGADLVITDRGRPIARLTPVDMGGLVKDLTDRGILALPAASSRTPATRDRRVPIQGESADLPRDDWR
jgi:prevent-host-death family protein